MPGSGYSPATERHRMYAQPTLLNVQSHSDSMSSQQLLIVESPAKAKTINKYLGKDFEVLASYGHVRDLRPKEGAVNPEQAFEMQYEVIERNRSTSTVSPRRCVKRRLCTLRLTRTEGEAIAGYLAELLAEKGLLDDKVAASGFLRDNAWCSPRSLEQARGLSTDLINAQQARRALDYLVGFNLSPLLWKKVRRGLSAGRVQHLRFE